MIKPGKWALSHLMCIQRKCSTAATLRRHLCSIRMPLESKKITSSILLKHPVSLDCVCVLGGGGDRHPCVLYMCGGGGAGTRLSCFVLISFACNHTTQSWQAMRLEMGPMRVK